ncbi:hypothetical protein LJK88_31010 [Paenibacillus sp. P26]|nr:hypothetical protein LJK88_31010 [Paenibacillus sp. P26]
MLAQTGMLIPAWLWVAGFYAVMRSLPPAGIRFLSRVGVTEVNYQGTSIPTAAGPLIWASTLGAEIICFFICPGGKAYGPELAKFAAATSMVAAACFMDDRYGDKSVKGVTGHWQAWTRGRTLTTGWLKAAAISAGALLMAEPGEASW